MSGRLVEELSRRAAQAMKQAFEVDADPEVRPTNDPRFGDYQINGVLPLARRLSENPRKLAERLMAVLDLGDMCTAPEIAGPGFINLRLDPAYIARQAGRIAVDPRADISAVEDPESVVVDFSSPNVAKRMHVGHLRSTIIGDALVRTLRFLGHKVVGDNHVGDWGTQFGILLWAWERHRDEAAFAADAIGELERLYKVGSEASKADPEVAAACRAELAALQAGDSGRLEQWRRFVAVSRADAEAIYTRLGVSFDTWHGESFFHDRLAGVVERLQATGLARESEGAIAVFFDEESDLGATPFLVQKSDGAYLYATTDIATFEYRVAAHAPDRIIYVVDVRQSLHFKQLFAVIASMGNEAVRLEHVGFGMMMGSDGRPFRTRDGGTITLAALLTEAEERILPIVVEKWPDATDAEQRAIAAQVGIGAVKYADLSQNLTTDYRFDWDKFLAAEGNTGPYLQYALVRIRSILREYEVRFGAPFTATGAPLVFEADQERELATELLKLGDALDSAARLSRPHILCEYLYGVARRFSPFYAACSILGAPDERLRDSRVALSVATARTLEIGLACLNIPPLERM
ncbi:MAG: arginine--tRNA ligase [Myxococcota bacterium]